MKRTTLWILFLIATLFFAPTATRAQKNAEPPTLETLMALERQANVASRSGDAKFFAGVLSDKFVMRSGAERRTKATLLKLVGSVKCNVTASSLDEPSLTRIDGDTYVMIYRNTTAGTCTAPDGSKVELPGTPERVATIWVRSGDKWLAAFHNSNPIVDPKDAPKAATAKTSGTKRRDATTVALAAAETAVWQAWKNHDRKRLESLVADSIAFVDIFGNAYADRADIITAWSGNICKVRSVAVTDAVSFSLSPTVRLLTHIGTANGTCYGTKIGPIYGNSIYVRSGKTWKLAFTMNMPATVPTPTPCTIAGGSVPRPPTPRNTDTSLNELNMQDIDNILRTVDQDCDGVSDFHDNCVRVANPDQNDRNKNRIGDACEKKRNSRQLKKSPK